MFLYGGSKPPPYAQNPNIANKQNKNYTSVFRQRTDFTHDAPSRRRQHTCFAYVLIPALHFQRACRQCVHESARLSRVICSHAWYRRDCGERQNHRLSLCHRAAHTCHARLARLTRARGRRFLRGWKILLNDFWYFSSQKSTIKKSCFMILHGSSRRRPLQDKTQSIANRKKQKICTLSRQCTHLIHARHALSAGVQTMRARICSAFSCDMFARVVV